MAGPLSAEWLNTNMSRAYPLADTTGGEPGTLPSDLLVDGLILTEDEGVVSAFISAIHVSDTGWSIDISAVYRDTNGTDSTVQYTNVLNVSFNTKQFAVVEFYKTGNKPISGTFTVGNARAVSDWAADTVLDSRSGEVSQAIIHEMPKSFATGTGHAQPTSIVTGILVGGTLLTGDVELIAGDGINLEVDTGTNSIRIVNTKYDIGQGSITSDEELLAAVVEEYGAPIKSICGITPDDNGNINIITTPQYDPDTNYIQVLNENSEAGTLILGLAQDPELWLEDIDTASENLKELNERAAQLDSGIKSADSAINRLATQMTRLS